MTTTTHIQEVKHNAIVHMKDVLMMLDWSEEQYAQFKYETGLKYLQLYMKGLPQMISYAESDRMFWNWWRNCWDNRDQVFIEHCKGYGVSRARLVYIYLGAHDPSKLLFEIRPPKCVREEAYKSVRKCSIN